MRWFLSLLLVTLSLHLGVAAAASCGAESPQMAASGLTPEPCGRGASGLAGPGGVELHAGITDSTSGCMAGCTAGCMAGCQSECPGCHASCGMALLLGHKSIAWPGATLTMVLTSDFFTPQWAETPYRPQWSVWTCLVLVRRPDSVCGAL